MPSETIDRNQRTWVSRHNEPGLPRSARRYKTKGRLPNSMNTMAITSTAGLSKYPTELSRVENPPVAIVVMACATASNPVMPANQYASAQIIVIAR